MDCNTLLYININMVGVKGFEPSTPASRTQVIAPKAAHFLYFDSTIWAILASKCARVRKRLYAYCAMAD